MQLELIRDLGIALGLGLLVGLQREWSQSKLAGIRTFALITLLGALSGMVAEQTGNTWIIAASLLAVAILFWIGNRLRLARGSADPGLTTEVAGLVMFIVGAAVMLGHAAVAVVTTGAVAALLHWKKPLHTLAERMGEDDFRAVVRLAIIGMVILPIMPNKAYGPYDVLNPFEIWLMVVLIVGISMAAYVAHRLLGAQVGTLLAGLLGGLISSTATTVSYARRSRARRDETAIAAIVIMIASTVVFGRVLFEIAIVAPGILEQVAPPLGAMMLFMAAVSVIAFMTARSNLESPDTGAPPSDLKAAVLFGVLYAAVLFAVAAVKDRFGDPGMYVVAGLSGMTDMDAITLSTAQFMKAQTIEMATGWRLILVGAMANLVFKVATVALLGFRGLLWRIAILFGISLAGGVALLLFWPE
ncbi:MAG: MgtC/SapB family protein [Planctomycetota bacterium]